METSLLLLGLLTVLEVVIFQEVDVDLISDIIKVHACEDSEASDCDIGGPVVQFLQLCSFINILINLVNIAFIYVTRSRQRNKNPAPVSLYWLDISTLRDILTWWTISKILFSSLLTIDLLLSGGVNWISLILVSSTGKF